MMKSYLVAAMLLFTAFCYSQIDAANKSVQVVGYWEKKESQAYDIVYEKSKVSGKDTIVTESRKYRVNITVTDSTSTSYTIEWKYSNYVIDDGKTDMQKKVAAMYNGFTIKFSTDEIGSFTGLLNWQDIKKHNENVFKVISNGTKIEAFETLSKLATKESLEKYAIKDILQFHSFFGIAVKEGEPIEQDAEERNSVTKQPVKSRIKLEVSDIDSSNNSYLINFWQEFDVTGFSGAIDNAFTEIAGKASDEKIEVTAMDDFYGAQMHEAGWPIEMLFQRTIVVNGETGLETRSITIQ